MNEMRAGSEEGKRGGVCDGNESQFSVTPLEDVTAIGRGGVGWVERQGV